jgi:glycerol-3-phosphate dehydrogenase (NAD(P)+)
MKKKIGYLGAGTWAIALASLLAKNGHKVVLWTRDKDVAEQLQTNRSHPKLKGFVFPELLRFTSDLSEAVLGADVLVESVTSAGIRPVFTQIQKLRPIHCPVIITSKGIEQKTLKLLPDVVCEIMGSPKSPLVGVLSGPSLADEVVKNLPTSVVCSAFDPKLTKLIQELFATPTFRIYPTSDLNGVCFGGAMKNIIAIACGIADGLGFGDNTKAALMTRGLHEIKKLSLVMHCKPETLNGLSGMGDLCVTCLSKHSRNYRFGFLIAEGLKPDEARKKIGMAVEGVYSCVSARELARQHKVSVPLTDVTYSVIYDGLDPKVAVKALLSREIKEEHL